jgi:hypothetical protein
LPDLCQTYGKPNFLLYTVRCHTYHTYQTFFYESSKSGEQYFCKEYVSPTARSWADFGMAGMVGVARHAARRATKGRNLSNINGLLAAPRRAASAIPRRFTPDLRHTSASAAGGDDVNADRWMRETTRRGCPTATAGRTREHGSAVYGHDGSIGLAGEVARHLRPAPAIRERLQSTRGAP